MCISHLLLFRFFRLIRFFLLFQAGCVGRRPAGTTYSLHIFNFADTTLIDPIYRFTERRHVACYFFLKKKYFCMPLSISP